MDRLEIKVPDMNDSFSKVVIGNTEYWLRFTWNDTKARWSFGIYTILREPIVQGIKLVPKFPINLQYIDERMPSGIFGVYSNLEAVGRPDFAEGRAVFAYIPKSEGS
jgi:hypothetical protein